MYILQDIMKGETIVLLCCMFGVHLGQHVTTSNESSPLGGSSNNDTEDIAEDDRATLTIMGLFPMTGIWSAG